MQHVSFKQLLPPLRLNTLAHIAKRLPSGFGLVIKVGLMALGCMSISAQGFDHYSALLSRSDAANPAHFEYTTVPYRLQSQARQTCPYSQGIMQCALQKLKLRNLAPLSVDDDYDLMQVIYYPNRDAPTTAVVIATRVGLQDDLINGERFRLSFKLLDYGKPNAHWQFVQYGVQHKCTKENNKDRWVISGCTSAGNG